MGTRGEFSLKDIPKDWKEQLFTYDKEEA